MIENFHEHFYGIDANREESLVEYGLLVAPGNIINPEQCEPSGEYMVVYKIGDDAYGNGYVKERDLDAIVTAFAWDIKGFLSYSGLTQQAWYELPFIHKIHGLMNYFGRPAVIGECHSPMTQDEVAERYLGPEYAIGECHIMIDENRGIYIPKVFADSVDRDKLVPDEGYDPAEDLECMEKGPDEEWYWEAMDNICRNCKIRIDGKLYDIEQNGDLWLYESEKRRPAGHNGE